MRRHTWSGAVVLAALALAAISCSGDTSAGAPVEAAHLPSTTTGQIALVRKADTMSVDQSLQLTAIAPIIPGSAAPSISWTSSDTSVAFVTKNGVLFALKSGKVTVTAARSGFSDAAAVLVNPGIRDIEFDSDSLAISLGHSIRIPYRVRDTDGNPVDLAKHRVEWISSAPEVAPLTGDATVTGRISVNAEGRKVVVPVTVTAGTSSSAPAVASVSVTLNASTLVVGQSTQATATLRDGSGNLLSGRSIVWTSSDAQIATVSGSGLVTANQAGSVTIKATSEGKVGSASLNVTAPAGETAVGSVTLSVPSSLNVGQSAQATVTVKDASGNVLTGRTISYVSSDANIVSISTSGLVSALKGGAVTITASTGGKSASAVVTAVAPKPPVATITLTANSSTLNVGDLTQVYAVAKDANGTTITGLPVAWSSSPSAVATVSSTGMASGRSAGSAQIYAKIDTVTRNITLTVVDTVPTPTSSSYPGGNGTLGSIATLAELPRATVSTAYPAPTRQVRVPAGASLQAAINAAQPGDELLLAPGATFIGNFTLPNKGSSTSWITIRTDVSDAAIGAPGTRMTPTRAASANLAKILTPSNWPAMAVSLSAHHYRLTGLEFSGTGAAYDINGIVRFGDGGSAQNSLSLVPHNLVLDRSYVHGQTTQEVRRCVSLQSATSAVIDSWISDCHSNQGDSQGIIGWNGPGPYLITNNHIEGGHEVILFGGADPWITNLSPSDITLKGNHIMRPLSWKGVWQAKTIVETKNARRLLIEGNVIENVWADAQVGFGLLLKSENQSGTAPWSQSTDITVRYNRIRNVGSGINIAANPGWALGVPAARISVYDNVLQNLGTSPYVGDGIPLQLLGGTYDIVVAHNSWSNAGRSAISFDGGAGTRTVIHSNIIPSGVYGVKGGGTGTGTTTINNYMPGGVFSYDVIVGADCVLYPATTTCPSSMPSTVGTGYDARAIGADVNKVNAATSSAIVAP